MRLIEIYPVETNHSKITINKERITFKVGADLPAQGADIIKFVELCDKEIFPEVTVRGGVTFGYEKGFRTYLRSENRKLAFYIVYDAENKSLSISERHFLANQ